MFINELSRREALTAFLTTHYADETNNRDRDDDTVAIDAAAIDAAAIEALAGTFGFEAAGRAVTFPAAPRGRQFVPLLRAEFGIPIK